MVTEIARRDVEIRDGDEVTPGCISVFAPDYHPADNTGSGYWECRCALDFGAYKYERYARGEDSYQALQLALGLVVVGIETAPVFQSGSLCLWGEPLTNTDRFFNVNRLGEA